MTPSVGRILHYHVPFVGWRPLLVTHVGGPTKWAVGDGENPIYVCGWAKLCPIDISKPALMDKLTEELGREVLIKNEYPVENSYEGVDFGCWRWPPRVQ